MSPIVSYNYMNFMQGRLQSIKLSKARFMALFNSLHLMQKCCIYSVIRQFFLPNQPKNLDPSYKTGLDLEGCFGMEKILQQH